MCVYLTSWNHYPIFGAVFLLGLNMIPVENANQLLNSSCSATLGWATVTHPKQITVREKMSQEKTSSIQNPLTFAAICWASTFPALRPHVPGESASLIVGLICLAMTSFPEDGRIYTKYEKLVDRSSRSVLNSWFIYSNHSELVIYGQHNRVIRNPMVEQSWPVIWEKAILMYDYVSM